MLLKENPFYILDVSLSSDRRKIAEAAEEISFLLGTDKSSEAQSVLINPAKRINAELSWFPEASSEDIAAIRNSISSEQPIIITSLTGYSKLNALVYNLELTDYSGIYELGYDIVAIDEQYTRINIEQVTKLINQAREKAGFSTVTENTVQDCHRIVIEEIRRLVNEKLKNYDEEAYIDFATVIAEQYIADKRHNAGPILFDIIDQYEIRMQSELDSKSKQIIQYVDLIKSEQNKDVIAKSIPKVIERVQAWDVYAQPLQLKSQATGLPHEMSRNLASEMRGLCLFLHNDKEMTSEARDLASAMKAVFLEVGEFREIFADDTQTLENIEKNSENAGFINELEKDFEKLDLAGSNLLKSELEPKQIKDYVEAVSSLNKKIKGSSLDKEIKDKLLTGLGYRARNIAIDIHNKKGNPLVAKYLTCVWRDMFADISELREKLKTDAEILDKNAPSVISTNMGTYKDFFDNYIGPAAMRAKFVAKARRDKWIKRIVIAAIAIFIIRSIVISRNNNLNSSRSSSLYSSTYGGSSTTNTKKPTNTATTKPTEVKEKVYSASSVKGDKVYVDIVSIYPQYYSYNSKTLENSDFTCKCITEKGDTVWVFFTASEYRKNIDSSAPTLNSLNDFMDVKTFSPAARIHGTISSTIVKETIGTKTLEVINFTSINIPKQVNSITASNVDEYFDITIDGKEFDSTKGLTVSYSIKPKSSAYATRSDSSDSITITINLEASAIKNGTSFKDKDFTIYLKKSLGYKGTGELLLPFTRNLDTVYWGYSIKSVKGVIGK